MKNEEMHLKYKIIDGSETFNIVENRTFMEGMSIIEIENILSMIHNKEIDLVSISKNAC